MARLRRLAGSATAASATASAAGPGDAATPPAPDDAAAPAAGAAVAWLRFRPFEDEETAKADDDGAPAG